VPRCPLPCRLARRAGAGVQRFLTWDTTYRLRLCWVICQRLAICVGHLFARSQGKLIRYDCVFAVKAIAAGLLTPIKPPRPQCVDTGGGARSCIMGVAFAWIECGDALRAGVQALRPFRCTLAMQWIVPVSWRVPYGPFFDSRTTE
jgi:hypothetical protein